MLVISRDPSVGLVVSITQCENLNHRIQRAQSHLFAFGLRLVKREWSTNCYQVVNCWYCQAKQLDMTSQVGHRLTPFASVAVPGLCLPRLVLVVCLPFMQKVDQTEEYIMTS